MTIALWCVLAAGFLPYILTVVAKSGGVDNRAPRDSAASFQGFRKRAYAAQLNGFEAFPLFAAAVIIAEMKGAPRAALDLMASGFVLARILYSGIYIADLASLRTLVWSIGFVLAVGIFFLPLWR